MKSLMFIFVIFLLSDLASAEMTTYSISRLDDSKITFYFDKPKDKQTFPIFLFLQGSECHTIHHRDTMPRNPSEMIPAAYLAVEKYGITSANDNAEDKKNCTSEFYQYNSFDQRIADYLRVIHYLREYEKGWNRKLYILGGSEGGALAPILSAFIPETKKAVMLVAGNGFPFYRDIEIVMPRALKASGATPEQTENVLKEMHDAFKEASANPRYDKQWGGQTYKWWNSTLNRNPLNYMLDLSIPMLLIHGTEDLNSPIESARNAAKSFKEKGKTNLEYWEFDGYDHYLKDKNGVNHKMEILQKAIGWIFK